MIFLAKDIKVFKVGTSDNIITVGSRDNIEVFAKWVGEMENLSK